MSGISKTVCAGLAVLLVSGCGAGALSGGPGGKISVTAAENIWGSIAEQIGGSHVSVTSIVTGPDADPHAYEPTPADARTVSAAQYVIVNGAGYDSWAAKLIDANPAPARQVLTVADLAGRKVGDNPHMWYDPAIVFKVINQIVTDYKSIDPGDASYFDTQKADFDTRTLRNYNDLRSSIKAKYAGVPIGATESVFVDMARDLGLDLITPPGYMKAISEGNDPAAADRTTFDGQVRRKRIKVLVFNSQNSTPDIQTLTDEARLEGIPVVAVTETLVPASATFEKWQSAQLQELQNALQRAAGA